MISDPITTAGIVILGLVVLTLALLAYAWPLQGRRRCKTCKHFDLTKGQAAMMQHPIFVQAAAAVPPQKMGVDCDEEGMPLPSNVPEETKWEEFGACNKDGFLIWNEDSCVDWRRKWPWTITK